MEVALFVADLLMRALLFGVCITASDVGKIPHGLESGKLERAERMSYPAVVSVFRMLWG